MATSDEYFVAGDAQSAQPRAFAATELVACPVCARSNPPTRANCLYCGAALGIAVQAPASTPAPAPRESESENLVHVLAMHAASDRSLINDETAQHLHLTRSELDLLFSGSLAPLHSATSETQAESILERLRTMGIEALTVSDDQLRLEQPARQIAALTIDDDSVTGHVRRTGEQVSVGWDQVALIVVGRLYLTTTEVEQERDKSKQVLDERQMVSDESVFDVYARNDENGWRIRSGSFDFSCLGTEKKVTAFENFRVLLEVLRRKAAHATFDDEYVRARPALNKVWPSDPQATTSERRRTLTRTFNATATTSDNELQFTRYSRLRRFIQTRESQNDAQP